MIRKHYLSKFVPFLNLHTAFALKKQQLRSTIRFVYFLYLKHKTHLYLTLGMIYQTNPYY